MPRGNVVRSKGSWELKVAAIDREDILTEMIPTYTNVTVSQDRSAGRKFSVLVGGTVVEKRDDLATAFASCTSVLVTSL